MIVYMIIHGVRQIDASSFHEWSSLEIIKKCNIHWVPQILEQILITHLF